MELTSPVTSENNIMPRDHQSAAWLYGPPLKTSGAAQTKQQQKMHNDRSDDAASEKVESQRQNLQHQ